MARRQFTITLTVDLDEDLVRDAQMDASLGARPSSDSQSPLDDAIAVVRTNVMHDAGIMFAEFDPLLGIVITGGTIDYFPPARDDLDDAL